MPLGQAVRQRAEPSCIGGKQEGVGGRQVALDRRCQNGKLPVGEVSCQDHLQRRARFLDEPLCAGLLLALLLALGVAPLPLPELQRVALRIAERPALFPPLAVALLLPPLTRLCRRLLLPGRLHTLAEDGQGQTEVAKRVENLALYDMDASEVCVVAPSFRANASPTTTIAPHPKCLELGQRRLEPRKGRVRAASFWDSAHTG